MKIFALVSTHNRHNKIYNIKKLFYWNEHKTSVIKVWSYRRTLLHYFGYNSFLSSLFFGWLNWYASLSINEYRIFIYCFFFFSVITICWLNTVFIAPCRNLYDMNCQWISSSSITLINIDDGTYIFIYLVKFMQYIVCSWEFLLYLCLMYCICFSIESNDINLTIYSNTFLL